MVINIIILAIISYISYMICNKSFLLKEEFKNAEQNTIIIFQISFILSNLVITFILLGISAAYGPPIFHPSEITSDPSELTFSTIPFETQSSVCAPIDLKISPRVFMYFLKTISEGKPIFPCNMCGVAYNL